jgi:hypothetical protein
VARPRKNTLIDSLLCELDALPTKMPANEITKTAVRWFIDLEVDA